jgi:membrane protease YdiL (CAAX protease family)
MLAGLSPFWLKMLTTLVFALVLGSFVLVTRRWWAGKPLVERMRHRRVPWGAEGALLAAFALFGALTAYLSDANGSESSDPLTIDLSMAAGLALTWFMLAGLVIFWIRSNYSATWRDFGAPRSLDEASDDVALGVMACAAMLVPVYAVQIVLVLVVGLPSSHPTVEQLMKSPSAETIVAAGLMAVVIAPIFEELAFRVLLQGWLERIGGRRAWWPVIVSAVLFALAHSGQGWAPVPLAVLAVGIGYVYRQTHRLVPIVAMHMAFNALGLAVALASGGQSDVVPVSAP